MAGECFVKEDSAFLPFQEGTGRRKLKASFIDTQHLSLTAESL